jgi:hypothetical protein
VPAGLLDVTWQDWYAAVVLAARHAAKESGPGKPFLAGGFSTGAALVTLYSVRGLEDARREGRRWFCSQSCHLQAPPARSRQHRGPARRAWRMVKWTAAVVALLSTALVVAALAGLGDTTSDKKAKNPTGAASARIGSRSRPVPFRHAAAIGAGWRMRVLAVAPNATRRVLAAGDRYAEAPAPGGQDYLIAVEATYVGGGKSVFAGYDAGERLRAFGRHGVIYDRSKDGCASHLPRPDLENNYRDVFSGRTVRGNICFQIASNDAASLRLFVTPPLLTNGGHQVWFALRQTPRKRH